MRYKNHSARRFLEDLSRTNQFVPIIVEGSRDVQALRSLGIRGCIVTVHSGRSIQQFCDEFSEVYAEAVILTDWDPRGNQIFALLTRFLEVNWERYSYFRERLRELSHGSFNEVEKIASWEPLLVSDTA